MSSRIAAERLSSVAATLAAVGRVTAFGAALLVAAPSAHAQKPAPSVPPVATVTPENVAFAQSLFDDARRLMMVNDFAHACPKLAESQRLDPALGTLLNLAVCNERLGKTASAWGEYRDAESVAKREGRLERASYARARAEGIEPRLSRLVIVVGAWHPERGLEVKLDDVVVREAAFGSPVPIDPGPHRLEARAPGKKPWATSLTIDAATLDAAPSTSTVEIPLLEDAPAPPPPPQQTLAQGGPLAITLPSAPPPEETHSSSRGISKRTVSYVVGGVAVAALAFGAVAGMQAVVKWNDRKDLCTGDSCPQDGLSADSTARQWALASDIGLGVGVVAAGTAAYLFVTSKRSEAAVQPPTAALRVVPTASAHGAGLGLSGAW